MAKSDELLKEYRKERKRVQSLIRSLEKRGYTLPMSGIKGLPKGAGETVSLKSLIPDIPKKITEGSIRRLKALTPAALYEKSVWVNPKTGEVLTGRQRRVRETWESHEKEKVPAIQDGVLKRIEEMIERWEPDPSWNEWFSKVKEGDRNALRNTLSAAIAESGRDSVAKRCQDHAEEVNQLAVAILYGSGAGTKGGYMAVRTEVAGDLATFAALIKGGPITPEESEQILDIVENSENQDELE